LAVSVARVIRRDSLAKIADTKIIGIGIEWYIWYYLSSAKTNKILLIFCELIWFINMASSCLTQ
jgi:hypothetical protein